VVTARTCKHARTNRLAVPLREGRLCWAIRSCSNVSLMTFHPIQLSFPSCEGHGSPKLA